MKNLLSIVIAVTICFSLFGCGNDLQDTDTGSGANDRIEVQKNISASLGEIPEIELLTGEDRSVAFKISGMENMSESSFDPVVINQSILDMEYERVSGKYVYYKVTARSEGITEIYLELSGTSLRSEKIKVVVKKPSPDYIIGAIGEASFSVIEGHTKTICFAVLGYDLVPEDVNIVVGNTSIAKAYYIKVSGKYAYYKIEGVAPGVTTVYLETEDGIISSDRISVSVIEKGNITDDEIEFIGYIASKNSTIFHLPTCSLADKIKDENKLYFECDRQVLIDDGYAPCKACEP